jgi:hypothetical protein
MERRVAKEIELFEADSDFHNINYVSGNLNIDYIRNGITYTFYISIPDKFPFNAPRFYILNPYYIDTEKKTMMDMCIRHIFRQSECSDEFTKQIMKKIYQFCFVSDKKVICLKEFVYHLGVAKNIDWCSPVKEMDKCIFSWVPGEKLLNKAKASVAIFNYVMDK